MLLICIIHIAIYGMYVTKNDGNYLKKNEE